MTVSIAGGVTHNIGQIAAAVILLQTASLMWYMVVLWFTGMAAGAVIGIMGAILVKRLEPGVDKIR